MSALGQSCAEVVEVFQAEYAEILTVRPGITDPASLKFRDEADFCGMPPIRRMYLTHILPEKVTLGREYATPVSDGGCVVDSPDGRHAVACKAPMRTDFRAGPVRLWATTASRSVLAPIYCLQRDIKESKVSAAIHGHGGIGTNDADSPRRNSLAYSSERNSLERQASAARHVGRKAVYGDRTGA